MLEWIRGGNKDDGGKGDWGKGVIGRKEDWGKDDRRKGDWGKGDGERVMEKRVMRDWDGSGKELIRWNEGRK